MRILVACDSFKESCSARVASQSIAQGILQARPDWQLDVCPLADGGEGTLAALAASVPARLEAVTVSGPLGAAVDAAIAWTRDIATLGAREATAIPSEASTAWIESASCLGLGLVPLGQRNPMLTSSFGLGQLIVHAMQRGAQRLVIGLGGSSTLDAGIGMAQALGLHFAAIAVPAGGGALAHVAHVETRGLPQARSQLRVLIATDVQSPLLGPRGAAHAFGPQKGATPAMVETLERSIEHYARRLLDACGPSDALHPLESEQRFRQAIQAPGAGAAGGLGFALMQLFNAETTSGIDLVMRCTGFAQRVARADLVITGEGKLDASSFEGKVVTGVLATAAQHGKPVAVVCGSVDLDAGQVAARGIAFVQSLAALAPTIQDAMQRAPEWLVKAGQSVVARAAPNTM